MHDAHNLLLAQGAQITHAFTNTHNNILTHRISINDRTTDLNFKLVSTTPQLKFLCDFH